MSTMQILSVFLFSGIASASLRGQRSLQTPRNEIRWASMGGGWRAMVADMAFANVFEQAGIVSNSSSHFTAVSTESGASWFSTQFFYSPNFFQKTVDSNPDELSDFVLQWMNAYQSWTEGLTPDPDCEFLSDFTTIDFLNELGDFCNVFVDYNGDWAAFVRDMLAATSENYGDSSFVDRPVIPENRVSALSDTDLYVQTSLAPVSRPPSDNRGVFLGPKGHKDIYSVPTAVQYTVSRNGHFFFGSTSDLLFRVQNSTSNVGISYPDGFKEFGLFPAMNQTALIESPFGSGPTGIMALPFGGTPTVAQISAASSAAIGVVSPLVPSIFSQFLSVERKAIQSESELFLYDEAVDIAYDMEILQDLSICSQWPQKCTEADGRFIDGSFTDSPTLALNVGQYQQTMNGNLSSTLKAIVTLNNECESRPEPFLAYFNTTFNADTEPGGFFWPENHTDWFSVPIQSPQIFDFALDEDTLSNLTNTVSGSNVTYAVVSGAITLENEAFQVKAGQTVDMLVLMLNSCIPVTMIGTASIKEYKQPLADMAKSISSSPELVQAVSDFFSSS